jgi:hypothetical protein
VAKVACAVVGERERTVERTHYPLHAAFPVSLNGLGEALAVGDAKQLALFVVVFKVAGGVAVAPFGASSLQRVLVRAYGGDVACVGRLFLLFFAGL